MRWELTALLPSLDRTNAAAAQPSGEAGAGQGRKGAMGQEELQFHNTEYTLIFYAFCAESGQSSSRFTAHCTVHGNHSLNV